MQQLKNSQGITLESIQGMNDKLRSLSDGIRHLPSEVIAAVREDLQTMGYHLEIAPEGVQILKIGHDLATDRIKRIDCQLHKIEEQVSSPESEKAPSTQSHADASQKENMAGRTSLPEKSISSNQEEGTLAEEQRLKQGITESAIGVSKGGNLRGVEEYVDRINGKSLAREQVQKIVQEADKILGNVQISPYTLEVNNQGLLTLRKRPMSVWNTIKLFFMTLFLQRISKADRASENNPLRQMIADERVLSNFRFEQSTSIISRMQGALERLDDEKKQLQQAIPSLERELSALRTEPQPESQEHVKKISQMLEEKKSRLDIVQKEHLIQAATLARFLKNYLNESASNLSRLQGRATFNSQHDALKDLKQLQTDQARDERELQRYLREIVQRSVQERYSDIANLPPPTFVDHCPEKTNDFIERQTNKEDLRAEESRIQNEILQLEQQVRRADKDSSHGPIQLTPDLSMEGRSKGAIDWADVRQLQVPDNPVWRLTVLHHDLRSIQLRLKGQELRFSELGIMDRRDNVREYSDPLLRGFGVAIQRVEYDGTQMTMHCQYSSKLDQEDIRRALKQFQTEFASPPQEYQFEPTLIQDSREMRIVIHKLKPKRL